MLTEGHIDHFRQIVWEYFQMHGRDMPWRIDPSPYHVLVSELMLQQTQVSRVVPKFEEFIARFGDIQVLANASLADVLAVWSGLGYNRRAKYLHAAAQRIVDEHDGRVPNTIDELVSLPGVGRNTAGAIMAYAFDQPVVFIETNVRSVFFHHFFANDTGVDDKDVLPLVEQTLDRKMPRQWYWALMDYGTYLKQAHGSNIAKSKHYTKQSIFAGSRRQLRGQIIRRLLLSPVTMDQLRAELADERLVSVIGDLIAEGFVQENTGTIRLTGLDKLP